MLVASREDESLIFLLHVSLFQTLPCLSVNTKTESSVLVDITSWTGLSKESGFETLPVDDFHRNALFSSSVKIALVVIPRTLSDSTGITSNRWKSEAAIGSTDAGV
jgi:hypothetical protein